MHTRGDGKKKQKAPMKMVFMFLGDVADDEKNQPRMTRREKKRKQRSKSVLGWKALGGTHEEKNANWSFHAEQPDRAGAPPLEIFEETSNISGFYVGARKRYKMNKWVKKHCGGGGGSDLGTGGAGGNDPGTGGAGTRIAA
ncbi:hypothetical protein F2Q69_00061440 [Brassica cretica]|uniref:Uncharacterized protein n=1 Tax=Brassica cretica TaxID=69181 RepID=A0A8S9REB0_BRACR|nr:hypothetical protein F2Q69_00061440 [Brassica cretica]